MTSLHQIIAGSLVLSVLHACMPNHWLPLVVIGRTERWSRLETLGVTAIAGLAHTASTLAIGLLVGWLGYELASRRTLFSGIVAPAVLVALGLAYLIADRLSRGHEHVPPPGGKRGSRAAVISSLVVAMFFSPCLEIEAYYLTAGALGWAGIAAVSAVYVLVTVLGMLLLVDLGLRGAARIRWHFWEHHERGISGAVLVVLGVLAYLVFK